MKKIRVWVGNPPPAKEWKLVKELGAGWQLYARRWSLSSDNYTGWINFKLIRRPNAKRKANYWFSFNRYDGNFARQNKALIILQEHHPLMFRIVRTNIRKKFDNSN